MLQAGRRSQHLFDNTFLRENSHVFGGMRGEGLRQGGILPHGERQTLSQKATVHVPYSMALVKIESIQRPPASRASCLGVLRSCSKP